MNRTAYLDLLSWKAEPKRKPLIIQGARQVGKTWLMREFGKQEFSEYAYFNFEQNPTLSAIFNQGFNLDRIVQSLSILHGKPIDRTRCLLIFDEIQACPNAITSLKYFAEEEGENFVFAAGSLLGVSHQQSVSFPVGKVNFLTLYPLHFHEFLEATGNQNLLSALSSGSEVAQVFAPQFIHLLRQYFYVGGMPEAVSDYALNKDLQRVRFIQKNILLAYENDFSKHAPSSQVPRIRLVWKSLLSQLAKENSKFIYNVLRPGGRARDFELAIEWLRNAGLVYQVHRISKSGLPLEAYQSISDFKIFLLDTGLLTAMGELDPQILLEEESLFTEFKGTLTEQFVLQQLVGAGYKAYYWSPDDGKSEVDFVVQQKNKVVPIEVKSSTNVKSRSLRVFYDKYTPERCIRTSLGGFQAQEWMQNIPLYAFLFWATQAKKE